MLGSAGAPILAQPREFDVLLAFARLHRRELSRVKAAATLAGKFLDHLRPPGRELTDHLKWHVPQLGHPFAWLLPLDTERARQLGAELRLVQVARGESIAAKDRLPVQRPPLAVARGLGHVGDDYVRVQMRVLGAAGAVLVGGRNEPARVLAVDTVPAAAGDARFVLEVSDGRLPGRQVGLIDGPTGLLVAERVQQAAALGDREDEVEASDRRELLRLHAALVGEWVDPLDRDLARLRMPAELLFGMRVDAADQPAELPLVHQAVELERSCAAAGPDAG